MEIGESGALPSIPAAGPGGGGDADAVAAEVAAAAAAAGIDTDPKSNMDDEDGVWEQTNT